MTTLITGGTGKTGFALAKLLDADKRPLLIASRSGTAPEPFGGKAVKFDWLDESTFENPFGVASAIDRVYLVLPLVENVFPIVKKFVDLATSKGVKRFVLCGGSAVGKGDGSHGKVHEYFDEIKVEYTILRPTWFIENFGTSFIHEINQKNQLSSLTKEGRIPFVSAEDIAQAAYDALVGQKSANTDLFVFGPTLYSLDEALALLSEAAGRKITHNKVTREERSATYTSFGLPKAIAEVFLTAEEKAAEGREESRTGGSNVITGKHELKDYFDANKSLWII